MTMSNPRESGLWTPRTQEFTGGHNGREMIDYDINPNEDNDGLSHHTLQTPEDEESGRQQNPKSRRERALRELTAVIPHISLKPEEIDDVLDRTPQMDGMQQLLESGLGVDMGQMAMVVHCLLGLMLAQLEVRGGKSVISPTLERQLKIVNAQNVIAQFLVARLVCFAMVNLRLFLIHRALKQIVAKHLTQSGKKRMLPPTHTPLCRI